MPFISEHILIDLPFYKPTESPSQGQNKFSWSDRVRGNCFATANENDKCIPSTHEKLGLCVQIKTGGELMFTLPREFALNDMLAKTKQFTVEFWAEPESLEGGHKQILSRPVEVWMEGRTLSWRWSSAQFQKTCTIEAGEGLHHWAIVVVESTDQPTVHIFRDGNAQTVPEPVPEPVSSPSSSSGSANLANPAHLTPLTIGAVSSGWTGKLAHLRIWSVALTLEQIQQNRNRDITAHAAFKASTEIEWRLLNAYDEPSIYIQSSRVQLDLRLEIENATKETTLEIPQTALSKDDPNNYHFQLEFRAGTIARKLLEGGEESALLKAIRDRNKGWTVSLTDQAGQDGIAFLRTESKISLEPGAKHTLWIPGIVAEPGSGSRSSHVMLRYQKIGINSGSGSPLTSFLDGHRLQRLNILYHEPSFDSYRKLPLEVGVVGAPVVLNNGTETCLTLYIKNLNRNEDGTAAPLVFGSANVSNDKQPKFVLEIDTLPQEGEVRISGNDLVRGDKYYIPSNKGEIFEVQEKKDDSLTVKKLNPQKSEESKMISIKSLKDVFIFRTINAQGLGEADDLMRIKPRLENRQFEIKDPTASGSVVSWAISPKRSTDTTDRSQVSLSANEIILISLSDLKTTAPPGRSVLRLRYKDFDKYGEGVFEIPIDRLPAIPAKITQGGAGYGLAIGHDPRVGKTDPNTESLDQILSIKQVGNGDAVRIENAGGGAGLNVVQKGSNLAAKFSGGSGVEIEKKLNAKDDVEVAGRLQIGQPIGNKNSDSSQGTKLYVSTVGKKARLDEQQTDASVSINTGLSLHLRLDNDTVRDLSTHQRPCRKEGNLEVISDPQLGNCFRFNGNEQIFCSNINLSNSSFTIQFWAKRREVTGSFIIGQTQSPTPSPQNNKSLHIGFRSPSNERTFTFAFWANDLDIPEQADTGWHHWACVYDLSQRKRVVYRDGKAVGNQSNIDSYLGTGNFVIGRAESISFRGELADIRVHTRALSAQEISLCMKAIVKKQGQQEQATPVVLIESVGASPGLVVDQSDNGLSARFSGGSGVEITGNLQVGQRIQDKTGDIMPVGAVLPFAGSRVPDGWLLCNGQQVIGDKYQDLAKVLFDEERFVFNLPDYRERFLTGATGAGDYILGKTGGNAAVMLTIDQMPRHKHDVQDKGHSHSVSSMRFGYAGRYARGSADMQEFTATTTTDKANIEEQDKGNSQAHENRPPFVALNYIIKY